jgi:hypothetical protein
MRKSWPFAVAVIVVGAIAGIAIAGRPVSNDPFVLDPTITARSAAAPTTDVIVSTSTTKPPTTTTTRAATTTVESTSTSVTRTTPVTTTSVSGTVASTVQPSTTTATAATLTRDQVRLVIANGDGRFRLSSITADRIRPLGYPIDLGDVPQKVVATIIYYRPGFDDEAAIVAQDILVPKAIIAAYPSDASQPITNSDVLGDVIVVLGPDAPR